MTMLKHQPATKNQKLEHLLPFEKLYEQYYLRIYRYLCTHLKNSDDAADLTQQIFFQVWMRLPTYQATRGSFATWLFRIARNRLIDFLRASRSSPSRETLCDIAISDLNPEEIVISAEMLAQVKTLIDALSPEERELLALRFAARLSIAEIAQIIGKSEEATKKQLSRLLRRLQERYRHLEDVWRQAYPREQQVVIFLSALSQVYAVFPPLIRLTCLREFPSLFLSRKYFS